MDLAALVAPGFGVMALGLAIWYWFAYAGAAASTMKTVIKTLSVACLALAAFAAGGPILLVAGLAFCALGDYFLALESKGTFLAGMGAFAIGHLFYIPLFWGVGGGLEALGARWWGVAGLIVLAIGMVRLLGPRVGALRLPVFGYIAVILTMGAAALSLPITGGLGPVMLGAVAFILSDLILASEVFVLPESAPQRRYSSLAVWGLYWGGQALIAFGMA